MTKNNLSDVLEREKSMIDIAYEILSEQVDSPKEYHSLLQEVSEIRGMTEEQIKERVGHLYTDMTLDGRFVNLGANQWGLRSWYPVDQTQEELSQTNKPLKKKGDDDEDDFLDEEDEFDEFEDLEDELDELANEEDDDLYDDEDKDLDEDVDDEDFDEDLDEPIDEDEEELL